MNLIAVGELEPGMLNQVRKKCPSLRAAHMEINTDPEDEAIARLLGDLTEDLNVVLKMTGGL